jgi:hypothetical protein
MGFDLKPVLELILGLLFIAVPLAFYGLYWVFKLYASKDIFIVAVCYLVIFSIIKGRITK